MPRRARVAPGGIVFHALNRGNGRLTLFHKPADYIAFAQIMAEAMCRHPTRLLGYILMPNHWHVALWPRREGEMSAGGGNVEKVCVPFFSPPFFSPAPGRGVMN